MGGPESLAELLFPSRDERFDRVLRALSQPQSGPHGDNLMSNEDSYPRVAGELARRVPPGGVYLGVGPDQNFTLVAHARPRLAVIMDYRRRNLLVHLLHKALFSLGRDRVSYLSRLLARRPGPLPANPTAAELVAAFAPAGLDRNRLRAITAEVAAVLGPLGVVDGREWNEVATIEARLAGPGMSARFLALPMYPTLGHLIETKDRASRPAHILAREDLYQRVRDLQLGDQILPIVGDYGRSPALPRLGAWLRKHALRISLFYISDVEFFLLRSGLFATYIENLQTLPWHQDALIVRTSTREIAHPARVAGDSSTTLLEPIAPFLAAARAGRIKTADDLFPLEPRPA